MRLVITPTDDVLRHYSNQLGALGEEDARKVMVRALNRTGGPTLTAVRRALAKQTSAPMSIIRMQVRGKKAWAGAGGTGKIEYVIEAAGRQLSLRHFKPREFRFGVRAKVWGRWQRYEGAFMKGGRFPERVDVPSLHGGVFRRDESSRLPIYKMYGPSLPYEMIKGETLKAFNTATERLGRDLGHEIGRVLHP